MGQRLEAPEDGLQRNTGIPLVVVQGHTPVRRFQILHWTIIGVCVHPIYILYVILICSYLL